MAKKFNIKDLDLSKRFPNYFTKWIFRGAIIMMIIVFCYILYLEDFNLSKTNHAYIECASSQPCINPFYECKQRENDTSLFIYTDIMNCDQYNSLEVEKEFYQIQYISPGEIIGEKPKYDFVYYLYGLIIILAFGLNHILYLIRRKKE